jgi:hypothetical protein
VVYRRGILPGTGTETVEVLERIMGASDDRVSSARLGRRDIRGSRLSQYQSRQTFNFGERLREIDLDRQHRERVDPGAQAVQISGGAIETVLNESARCFHD